MPRGAVAGRSRDTGRTQSSREWVGGRLSTPFFIDDRPEPCRPEIVLWVELPDGVVVGEAVVMPEDSEGAVARALRSTMAQPAVGAPRARADALRERIEAACGSRVRHRAREHTDPRALRKGPGKRPAATAAASPEEESLVAELQARHYAGWIDQPLPALNRKTPRE